jgi:transposase-like protein
MANRSQFKMSIAQRQVRHFSDTIKIQKVREIESGQTKISEIVTEYEVASITVYRWMKKFGTMKKKPERLIVEADSDTVKLLELKKKIADLERTIGQKQILIDFKDKMIELAEEHYKIDIKKNFSTQQSITIGKTVKK